MTTARGEGLKAGGWLVDGRCWVPDYRDALRVAAKLGIPLIKLDFTKEYRRLVLNYMFKEYAAGRTPNPDVLCNKFVKFGVWLDKAREMGFDYLATGHYARLGREFPISRATAGSCSRRDNFQFPIKSKFSMSNIKLLCAKDDNKDQTYFLHQLTQEQLSQVLFPVGDYMKPEVRKLAKKFDLPTAEKEESMGICFVGEVPMKEFLQTKIKKKIGNVVLSATALATPPEPPLGKRGIPTVIGQHDGLAFYTIGQRHVGVHSSQFIVHSKSPLGRGRGGLAQNKPFYVVAKQSETNELVVGYEDDPLLYKKKIQVSEVNWISGHEPKFPLQCEVRLRHRQPLQKTVVDKSPLGRGRGGLAVRFATPQRAVTPGQFAVFYMPRRSSKGAKAGENGECLGGGVIM